MTTTETLIHSGKLCGSVKTRDWWYGQSQVVITPSKAFDQSRSVKHTVALHYAQEFYDNFRTWTDEHLSFAAALCIDNVVL